MNDGFETITATDYIIHLFLTTTVYYSKKVNTVVLLSISTIVSAANISTLYYRINFVIRRTDLYTVNATGSITKEIPTTVTYTIIQTITDMIDYVTYVGVSNATKPTPIVLNYSSNNTSYSDRSVTITTVINGRATVTVLCDECKKTNNSKVDVFDVQSSIASPKSLNTMEVTASMATISNRYIYIYEGVGNSLTFSLSSSIIFMIYSFFF